MQTKMADWDGNLQKPFLATVYNYSYNGIFRIWNEMQAIYVNIIPTPKDTLNSKVYVFNV